MSKNKTLTSVAIFSIFMLLMGVGTVGAAIQSIAQAFPQVPFTTVLLVSSLPSLMIIPFTILSGAVAGSKVKYRTLVIIGMVFFTVAGVAPMFLNDFTTILVTRAVFGMGLGIITPLGNVLILKLFDEKERANMLGLSNLLQNVGAIVLQMGGAILCSINWRYTFAAHLLGVLSLIIVLFALPEPEKTQQVSGGKVKMPLGVYGMSTLLGACFLFFFPMLYNMSTLMAIENIGNPTSAGVVLSMFTVGGMAGGAIFGKLFQICGRFTISLAILLCGAGLAIMYYGNNMLVLSIGTTVTGIGAVVIVPGIMMIFGRIVPPAGFGLATGIMMAFLNLASFVTPYYMALLAQVSGQASVRFPFFFGAACLIVLAIGYGLMNLKAPAQPPAAAA